MIPTTMGMFAFHMRKLNQFLTMTSFAAASAALIPTALFEDFGEPKSLSPIIKNYVGKRFVPGGKEPVIIRAVVRIVVEEGTGMNSEEMVEDAIVVDATVVEEETMV